MTGVTHRVGGGKGRDGGLGGVMAMARSAGTTVEMKRDRVAVSRCGH